MQNLLMCLAFVFVLLTIAAEDPVTQILMLALAAGLVWLSSATPRRRYLGKLATAPDYDVVLADFRCAKCDSPLMQMRATVQWNFAQQSWDVVDVENEGHECYVCGHDKVETSYIRKERR